MPVKVGGVSSSSQPEVKIRKTSQKSPARQSKYASTGHAQTNGFTENIMPPAVHRIGGRDTTIQVLVRSITRTINKDKQHDDEQDCNY